MHYCDSEKELEALCDCKVNVDYSKVLLCETEKYFIDDITTTKDDKYVLMNCRFYLKITYLHNNKIMSSNELVKLKMIRSLSSLQGIRSDFLNYKCKSCGASLSLLNDGVCKYCGNKTLLENFDWKVVEYKSDWKNKY